jgi:hypothetical protein
VSWLLLLSLILSAAWIPILLFFLKNWRERGNPISLAICGLVGFSAYTDAMVWLYFSNNCNPYALLAMHIMQALVMIFFYVSFKWTKKKFKGRLGPEDRGPKS